MSKRSSPRFAIYCDCRRPLQDGTCPLRLRLTYHRKVRYIGLESIYWLDKSVPVSLPVEDWKKVDTKRPKGEWANTRLKLDQLVAHAEETLSTLHPPINRIQFSDYDWKRFEKKFLQEPGEDSDVFFWFARTIEQCLAEKRHNTASVYEVAMIAAQRFSGPALPLESITPYWLERLEKFWAAEGRKAGGMAVDFRSLRAVINTAIRGGAMSRDKYPFGQDGYTIKSGKGRQEKVLQWGELTRLWFFRPEPESLAGKALDFWKLSYLWQGANPADMFRFKNKDVRNGRIVFDRKKTSNTKRGGGQISVFVDGEAEEIARKWSVNDSPEAYLLPVLELGMSEKEVVQTINYTRSNLNKQLKKVAKELGLPKFSLAWARPTFATHMERHGGTIREIQSALGHSNRATTEIYLSREDDIRESVKRAIPGESKG